MPKTDRPEKSFQSVGTSPYVLQERAATARRVGPLSSVMIAEECPFLATSLIISFFAKPTYKVNFKLR